jgi:hypothetical protein
MCLSNEKGSEKALSMVKRCLMFQNGECHFMLQGFQSEDWVRLWKF